MRDAITILDLPHDLRELVTLRPKPHGYVTCWGFLLHTEPGTLLLMQDPIGGLVEEERRARRIAYEKRSPVMLFPAPKALIEKGLAEVGAYALPIWRRVFPVNP